MNCDEVFGILTRGPFPTGEPWDEQVEAHLEHCGDCWRLAEALRPALEIFQESVPPAESRDLPGYWGDARPAGAMVAELTTTARRTMPAVDKRHRQVTLPNPAQQPVIGEFALEVLRASVFSAVFVGGIVALVVYWMG